MRGRPEKKGGTLGEGEDQSRMGWKKDMVTVAESLSAGNQAMGDWKVSDMTVGLAYLSSQRKQEFDYADRRQGLSACSKTDEKRLERFQWASELADIAYIKSESVIRKVLQSEHGLVLVHAETKSTFKVPAHYWAYDRSKKVVVFGVRGTASKKDVLTDLDSKAEIRRGRAMHRGMLQSALALHEKVHQQLFDLAQEGFSVVLVGHSLGAGTAALLSTLLKETIENNLTCYAIAPPPVCELSMAAEARPYIQSLVCNDDIVCRMSVANLRGLKEELLGLRWGDMAKEDLAGTRAGKMATAMGTKCGDVATRLAAVQQARGVASYGKSAVTQASTYGKKAVSITTSLVKPKLGSLASFATDKVSKGVSKLGLGNSKAEASSQEEAYPAVAGGAGGAAGESGPILPLYPPGSITLMVRTNDEGDHEALEVDATWSGLCRFELSETMVSDHYLTSYFSALARCRGLPPPQPEEVLRTRMWKKEGGKKATLGMAEWKEREIRLLRMRRTLIVEYASGKDAKPRQVNLNGARVVEEVAGGGREREFAFGIETEFGQTLKLDPGSAPERERWLEELRAML